MKIATILLLATLVGGALSTAAGAPGASASAARKAICVVCQVKHGEAEAEPVRAMRSHGGAEYAFCSEKCAREFDADPAAYVQATAASAPPDLNVRDLQGKPITWADLRGKVVLLDFWATWCAPCRKAMPELQALHDKYSGRGFQVLGISIDEGGPAKVRKYVDSRKLTYPMALDSEDAPTWEAFKVKGIPAAFLLDASGNVVARWTGAVDPALIEERLRRLLPAAD